MNNCIHVGENGKYCSQCASPINVTAREPGEIRRMRSVLKAQLNALKDSKDAAHTLSAAVAFIFMDSTLQWTLGELNDESFVKIAAAIKE